MSVTTSTRPVAPSARPALDRRRARAAGLLVLFVVQAMLGLAWDISWHGVIGRDSFWTPPHLMIYSGFTLAGLVCAAIILAETRRADAAVRRTTVTLLGALRAPAGFFLAAFGLGTLLVAAPLDDYWHQLYGLDAKLWTPFHVMGAIGAALATLGAAHVLGAVAARARRTDRAGRRLLGLSLPELLLLVALAALMTEALTFARPALTQHPTIALGPLDLITYPVLLAVLLPALFVAAVRATGQPHAAGLVVGCCTLIVGMDALFVPWAIRLLAASEGLLLRNGELPPVQLQEARFVLLSLAPALLVGALANLGPRPGGPLRLPGRGTLLAGAAAAVPLLLLSLGPAQGALAAADIEVAPWTYGLTAGAALAAGALGGWLGGGLGAMLRLNER
jgi:hypothetical protein